MELHWPAAAPAGGASSLRVRKSGQAPRDQTAHKAVPEEAPPGFEPGIKDLQSSALPLGHGANAKGSSA